MLRITELKLPIDHPEEDLRTAIVPRDQVMRGCPFIETIAGADVEGDNPVEVSTTHQEQIPHRVGDEHFTSCQALEAEGKQRQIGRLRWGERREGLESAHGLVSPGSRGLR